MVLWRLFRRLFFKCDSSLLYMTLRFVCILYVIPVGYTLIQLTQRNGYLQSDGFWQLNFMPTRQLHVLVLVMAVAWLCLSVRFITLYAKGSRHLRKVCQNQVPEDSQPVLEEFHRVCEKLKIRKNLRLYRCENLPSPMIRGIWKPYIMIPDQKYGQEQLAVIFYHELTHYKSHDIVYKLCCVYVGVLQHQNASANRLLDFMHEWSEFDCDRRAITAMKDERTAGRYFEMIMEMTRDRIHKPDEEHIFSMLSYDQQSLERRIDYMRKYNETKRVAKGVTAIMTFAFAMLSVSTAYAAGTGAAEAHDYLYRSTEQVVGESLAADQELEEHFLSGAMDNTYSDLVYEGNSIQTYGLFDPIEENEIISFEWLISPDVRHVSEKLKLVEGQKVAVSCSVVPASITCWIGIMNSAGDVRFVQGSGALAHEFEIYEDDSYRVLVQNRGLSTITASGSFFYYTPEDSTAK